MSGFVGRYFSTKTKFVSSTAALTESKFVWEFEPIADLWMNRMSPIMLEILRAEAPVGKHFDLQGSSHPTYELRNSIYPVQYHGVGSVRLEANSRTPQAAFLKYGTKPHEINPKGDHPLSFWWPAYGAVQSWGWHGKKYGMVQHPGTRPNDYANKALARLIPEATSILSEELQARYP